MVEHGFSYEALSNMSLSELRFWSKELNAYYERLQEEQW